MAVKMGKIIGAVLFVLLVAGCREGAQAPAAAPVKVVIAWSAPQACLVPIAFDRGYFQAEGIEAVLQAQTSGMAALQSVLDGKADLATVAETPIVHAVMRGEQLAIIATVATANRNQAIVVRKDRGIATPADLQGKSVGVTLGTNGEFFLDTFFIAHGIERSKVRVVDLKPEAMVAALTTGSVDAVATWQPYVLRLQSALGAAGMTIPSEELYTENYSAVLRRDLLSQQPELAARLLRALVRAEEAIARQPDDARRLLAECTGVESAQAAELQGIFDLKVGLQQSLLISLEDQARWALPREEHGKAQMRDMLDYIHPEGLLAVKPEAVRLIR